MKIVIDTHVVISGIFFNGNPRKVIESVCRDSDDDKFINCAVDAKALYIVSGDSDLLDIKEHVNRDFFC